MVGYNTAVRCFELKMSWNNNYILGLQGIPWREHPETNAVVVTSMLLCGLAPGSMDMRQSVPYDLWPKSLPLFCFIAQIHNWSTVLTYSVFIPDFHTITVLHNKKSLVKSNKPISAIWFITSMITAYRKGFFANQSLQWITYWSHNLLQLWI